MKKLRFDELVLVSMRDRRAKTIRFHPRTTIIQGDNDVGKSCLLKSIYWCLGAEPELHPSWVSISPLALLSVSVDEAGFYFLRQGSHFAVFDSDGHLISTFSSVTSGLGPYLGQLLDFRLRLKSRDGSPIVPPPAFKLLPYYMDQDSSWTSNWSSFQRLGQFAGYRSDLVRYHVGMRPNEYYDLLESMGEVDLKISRCETESQSLRQVLSSFERRTGKEAVVINLDEFREEISSLLVEVNRLTMKAEDIRDNLTRLYNRRILVEAQTAIARSALKEAAADFDYATYSANDDSVACPTCGAEYENRFAERFSIAKDEDRCYELISELEQELATVQADLSKTEMQYTGIQRFQEELQHTLATKKGEVRLQDVIEAEGRRGVRRSLHEDIASQRSHQAILAEEKSIIAAKMKAALDKDREHVIQQCYLDYMRQYLHALDVTTLSEAKFRRIDSKIKETGSALPRAILAYFFSILCTMDRYGTSAACPIIIDEPNQQGQDDLNMGSVLKFIRDQRPADSQLILGIVDDHGVQFDGDTVYLKNKRHLLRESDYGKGLDRVKPFLDKSLSLSK